MRDELDRVAGALAALDRRELLDRLLPGLPKDEVVRRLEQAVAPPPCLVELYSWRAGTRAGPDTKLGDIAFFPGFYLLSVDDAIVDYLAFRDHPRWNPDWFPIFANGGGDFYAAVLSDDKCPIVGFMIDEDEQPIEYETLEAMIATLADCFDQGAFFVDDRGYLQMDSARHGEIARAHNPTVALWAAA
ncbi:MAG TPA: SMI1/KNR4 family protein [Solirubrobacteraceae bacterium]|nr:SMI1/KNR4 family protein [Solirubrobacteraceae bacterium]